MGDSFAAFKSFPVILDVFAGRYACIDLVRCGSLWDRYIYGYCGSMLVVLGGSVF